MTASTPAVSAVASSSASASSATDDTRPILHWIEDDRAHQARWQCANDMPMPKNVLPCDDTMSGDVAYRLACEGTALLWRGDFQNAKMLLQALARRIDKAKERKLVVTQRKAGSKTEKTIPGDPRAAAFHQHRQKQAQRARVLSMVLILVDENFVINLRRAPDVSLPCGEVLGKNKAAFVISLRELQGLIGAHEWRKKGVPIPALGASIHPNYGVFSPVRGEYVELVARVPLPAALATLPAYDIGTGTGVLAAVLAKRGVKKIIATEQEKTILWCAKDNLQRLRYLPQVQLVQTDLFPSAELGPAGLIVCNPPWIPAKPSAAIEHAIYDPESRMLRAFLQGVKAHLAPNGEAWLILSDIAEHLGLRKREDLLQWIADAGLKVAGRHDIRPAHAKSQDNTDPLHQARSAELTSLWQLTLPILG